MSLVRHGPAVTSLDEGIAVSTLFRAAKLVGDQIVPTFQSQTRPATILSRSAT
jgi:hypothetical protein